MAKETKSLTVSPEEEQNTIELYELFGWELQSSQEVFNKDSHLERSGDEIRNVTTTTNHVKLVFTREKTMDNYFEISQLENEFHSVRFPLEPKGSKLKILGGFLCLFGLSGIVGGAILVAIPVFALAVVCFVIAAKKNKEKREVYQKAYNVAVEKRQEILSKVSKLV